MRPGTIMRYKHSHTAVFLVVDNNKPGPKQHNAISLVNAGAWTVGGKLFMNLSSSLLEVVWEPRDDR